MVGKHLGARKDHPGLKTKENDENCGPTTTVFVGNISEKASDMLIRQLLAVSQTVYFSLKFLLLILNLGNSRRLNNYFLLFTLKNFSLPKKVK